MYPRVSQFFNLVKQLERNIFYNLFGGPPKGLREQGTPTQHWSVLDKATMNVNTSSGMSGILGGGKQEFAIAYVGENKHSPINNKISLKDIIGDGTLLAVPKFRRTIEKRWKRKFGSPDYVWKMLVPKTNIKVCRDCGHHHENGRLCENCYSKIKAETEEIKQKIQEKLGSGPIEKDVIVLYEGDNTQEQPKEFWKGKRIIEMQKERPQWFSKNLLQKTTKGPSDSTDVKPTDLA